MTALPSPLSNSERRIAAALGLVVFLFSLAHYDGPSRGYWDTYISVPAMFMTGQPVDLHRIDGTPRFDYRLKERLPDDTYDPSPGGFGIASKDQRIGTSIVFGAPFAIFRLAAFRGGFAIAWTLLFAFGFLALRRLLAPSTSVAARFAIPLGGALLLVFNPFSLYLDRLNGNTFGLAIQVLLFFLLLEERPVWWLIGLVYGLLGGIRNEAIVLAPMMLAFLFRRAPSTGAGRWRAFARDLAVFTLFAFVAILPVLLWNRFAYGQMLIHPSQVKALEGFRPTFPHRFFGAEFQFNGLLNWPFHDRLVRTPHFAFPTSMLWPLVTLKSFGVLPVALAIAGVPALFRRRRFEAAMLACWYLVYYTLFFAQENWEELKQTFMALHLFPLVAFMAAGARWLAEGWGARRGLVTIAIAGGLAALVLACRLVDVPADERWYVRFPHAARNESGLAELPDERRMDWHYFYTREVPSEAARERRFMTTPNLLPARYRPWHLATAAELRAALAEPWTRHLRTLAIWSYIYE